MKAYQFPMVQMMLSSGRNYYDTMNSIKGVCGAQKHSEPTEASDNITTVWPHSPAGASEKLIIL